MKHALHFGLNALNPADYGGFGGWLSGPQHDAVEMARIASLHGFTVTAAFDPQATMDRWRFEMARFARDLKPGDTLFLTYSGHGGQVKDEFEIDGTAETLCLYDGQILDREIRQQFAAFSPGVRIVWVVDACHSGGISRSLNDERPKTLPRSLHLPRNYDNWPLMRSDVEASVAILTACEEAEVAWDGGVLGNWTESLLSTIPSRVNLYFQRAVFRPLTYRDWFKAARQFCIKKWDRQHPVARTLGPSDILDEPLFT